jgi:hypothetical protein
MKGKFTFFTFIISLAFATCSFGQTPVPNGNFETWTDTVTAASWSSNNYTIGGVINYNFVHQSTDAHGGTYAAKLVTANIPILGDMGGLITLGTYDILTGLSGGQGITGKPLKLKGYFKYAPIANDTMAVIVIMTKWNGTSRDTLFYNGIMTNTAISTYTLFEVPISYTPSTASPDTMNIIATSSAGYAPQIGSALFLDDLSFEYGAGINETADNSILSVFPNPTTGNITVLLDGESNTITVSNVLGEVIYSQNTTSKNLNIDLSSFTDGIYMLGVDNGKSKHFQKLILSR